MSLLHRCKWKQKIPKTIYTYAQHLKLWNVFVATIILRLHAANIEPQKLADDIFLLKF